MRATRLPVAMAALALVPAAEAQRPVPVTAEPHHHLTWTDSLVRVFRVEVPPRRATQLHEHAVDYFWIAVGASEFVNAVAGKPEATVVAADASVHFTRGGFAHVARNEGASPFFNVTFELLRPQANPRNLCEQVLPGDAGDCQRAMMIADEEFKGAPVRPEFETDQIAVALLTIDPNGTLQIAPASDPVLIVGIDDTGGEATLRCDVLGTASRNTLGSRSGDVSALPKGVSCAIRNPGPSRVRLLALDFKSSAR
ncbi:MAG TPA: hypothetical protein VHE78_16090 [Gemmatimonadaceae bacterium]|nr:hypothetical protein [Gemmatimonadaceae bacterium]